jgi:uncharacterized membrane protein YqjE
MDAKNAPVPLVSLVTQLASDFAYLLQTEIRMARAELSEKLSVAANAGLFVGAAVILLLGGFIVLLIDIARWLEVAGLSYPWSLLLVAIVSLVTAGAVALAGVRQLKESSLVPQRTLKQMREDFTVAKDHVR